MRRISSSKTNYSAASRTHNSRPWNVRVIWTLKHITNLSNISALVEWWLAHSATIAMTPVRSPRLSLMSPNRAKRVWQLGTECLTSFQNLQLYNGWFVPCTSRIKLNIISKAYGTNPQQQKSVASCPYAFSNANKTYLYKIKYLSWSIFTIQLCLPMRM